MTGRRRLEQGEGLRLLRALVAQGKHLGVELSGLGRVADFAPGAVVHVQDVGLAWLDGREEERAAERKSGPAFSLRARVTLVNG